VRREKREALRNAERSKRQARLDKRRAAESRAEAKRLAESKKVAELEKREAEIMQRLRQRMASAQVAPETVVADQNTKANQCETAVAEPTAADEEEKQRRAAEMEAAAEQERIEALQQAEIEAAKREEQKRQEKEEAERRRRQDIEDAFEAVANKTATIAQVQLVERQRKLEESQLSDSSDE